MKPCLITVAVLLVVVAVLAYNAGFRTGVRGVASLMPAS